MFSCSNCDAQYPKWTGRCTECGKWGTVADEATGGGSSPHLAKDGIKRKAAKTTPLTQAIKEAAGPRISSGDAEVDRVLGAGIVPGSLVLLSGEPGIGKSTLVAQIAAQILVGDKPVLYISGEESASQLANRFERLGVSADHVQFLEALPIEVLVSTIEHASPALAIVDSVQTLSSDCLDAVAGTPTMVRYATSLLLELAKRTNIPILLIGQVTKDGAIAGPKTLEHLVDVVVSLEGDPSHSYRLLRASKNRFGSTGEVGVFEMVEHGLQAVPNPSARFLAERADTPGSVIAAAVEGSRVFLVEVQSLVEKSAFGTPVRRASGFDQNRLQMLCAILSKRAGVRLSDMDVYVNVIGGLQLEEPAADLAVCASIVGAYQSVPSGPPVLYVGEVGLGGEIRSVPGLERRLTEAKRMGIEKSIGPAQVKLVKDLL
jgi:DNA repair protein RadA/Sms